MAPSILQKPAYWKVHLQQPASCPVTSILQKLMSTTCHTITHVSNPDAVLAQSLCHVVKSIQQKPTSTNGTTHVLNIDARVS